MVCRQRLSCRGIGSNIRDRHREAARTVRVREDGPLNCHRIASSGYHRHPLPAHRGHSRLHQQPARPAQRGRRPAPAAVGRRGREHPGRGHRLRQRLHRPARGRALAARAATAATALRANSRLRLLALRSSTRPISRRLLPCCRNAASVTRSSRPPRRRHHRRRPPTPPLLHHRLASPKAPRQAPGPLGAPVVEPDGPCFTPRSPRHR